MNQSQIEAIANYIIDCLNNNVDDSVFVQQITKMMVDMHQLNKFVLDVQLADVYLDSRSTRGMLDQHGCLQIFRQGIEATLSDELTKVPNLSEWEIKLFKYLIYTKTIIHELEHVKQKKILNEDLHNQEIETIIYRMCDEANDSVLYNSFHDVYPTERMADLVAYRLLKNIVECLEMKMDIKMLACFIKRRAIFEEFISYYNSHSMEGATKTFCKLFGDKYLPDLERALSNTNLSLEDRIFYGLEITWDEYKQVVMQYGELDEELKSLNANIKK